MNSINQEDVDREEQEEDMEGQQNQEAHFSAFSQRIFLWPRGLFSKKEAPSFFRKPKIIRGSMIFLAVFSFLMFLIVYPQMLSKVTDIQTSIQTLTEILETARPQAQMMSSRLGNVNAEIQMLKKDLQNVSSESQRANSNLKNASDEVQILKRGLENANVQTQMANSNLKSASDEIKKLKESLENTNAFHSEAQRLSSGLEKANGEIQKIMESLVNTSSLKDEVQGLRQQLENLTAQQQQQSHQNSLLQLIIQGWYFYKGKAYYFSETQKTWDEAEEFCVAHNSHLASVTSDDEQEFLSKRTNGVYHWIGLTDKDTEGTWHWVDGTPYNENKVFWNNNQPDNWQYGKGLSEDCVHIEVKWNDMLCDKPYRWICKRVTGLPEQRP
ncbi:C-type lectin domain family 4 member F-like [Antechinus flavipes]|uniref:C-type lectin domain family 4 member F-like n=1 Tax=Antechinus flavipes TaxID=38775 RepID=UPI002236A095|nr:C-type lectin domain family 4 member F-like [Antechinus flavipes]